MTRPRIDAPGVLHHFVSRAVNQRTMFETRRDVRYFLSLLAREVRKGRLRVRVYAIMTNHFHVVAESVLGELSSALQEILSKYVRYFNRTRERTGHFVEARFFSKRIRSRQQLFNSIRYTDHNPSEAGLSDNPTKYPFGSARHYCSAKRPPWLDTRWVDQAMGSPSVIGRCGAYQRVFGRPLTASEVEVMRHRLENPAEEQEGEWDSLVAAAPDYVRSWMIEKAQQADGSRPGQAFVGAARVMDAVGACRSGRTLECRGRGKRLMDAWPIMAAGLLRTLSGLTLQQIALRVGTSVPTAGLRAKRHRLLLQEDEAYLREAVAAARACLRQGGAGPVLPRL